MVDSIEIKITPATDADCATIAAIARSVVPQYQGIMPGAFERWADGLRNQLPRAYELSLLQCRKQTVGFLGLASPSPTTAYLVALYFYPEYQRQGLGTSTLSEVFSQLRSQGMTQVILQVHQEAHWAIAFYRKHGFSTFTSEFAEIQQYGNGIIKEFAIPSTMLMVHEL